ncbi:MAG: hypothetical protein J6A05_10140 [Oscillospiraceae bacterium]|nr:hypothetical protein [Oscillospiraceae bacterium]
MEELLVYAILICEGFDLEDEFQSRLDEMFLNNPNSNDLLELECMSNIKNQIVYIRTNFDYNNINIESFGKTLMKKLTVAYHSTNLRCFLGMMFSLWEALPGNIQDIEPFHTLTYGDEPLCYNDEQQSRILIEKMLNYYENSCQD